MPFDEIDEKLKRADENIGNLNAELMRFFDEGKYCPLPHQDMHLMQKAIAYHRQRLIPLRFSVLAGEIVHHLRSCLDYVIWMFSTEQEQREHPTRIAFPVFEHKPTTKDEIARYERQIKGISDAVIRRLIEDLQPYKHPRPDRHPLLTLHRMDIEDKHRALVLCFSIGHLEMPKSIIDGYLTGKGKDFDTDILLADLYAEIKQYGKVSPTIAFRDFCGRKVEAVIPALKHLSDSVKDSVSLFRDLG